MSDRDNLCGRVPSINYIQLGSFAPCFTVLWF
jgi:hypothetical protein